MPPASFATWALLKMLSLRSRPPAVSPGPNIFQSHAAQIWRRGAPGIGLRPGGLFSPAREIFATRLRNEMRTQDENRREKERIMKWTLMVLGLAMAAGCAHGSSARSQPNELRGSSQVDASGRMLLAGPAGSVHASVDGRHGVKLFLVERVHGDDRDCRVTPYTQWVTKSANVAVGA